MFMLFFKEITVDNQALADTPGPHEAIERREGVVVTQADREAAMGDNVARGYTARTKAKVLRAEKDGDELVQAFARHRHESTASLVVEVALLREQLAAYQRFAGETAGACLGLAMSTDHPEPDTVLMDIFQRSQALAADTRAALLACQRCGS